MNHDQGPVQGPGRKVWKRTLTLFLLFALALGLMPGPQILVANQSAEMSAADRAEIERKMRELEELNKNISNYQKEMKENSQAQKNVIGQLKNLQENMNQVEKELASLDKQLGQTLESIRFLEDSITVKTAEVDERNAFLGGRLKQIYIDGEVSYLDVLFESSSITDFLTRYDLMAKVVENDMELLAGLKEERTLLESQKAALEQAKANLESIKQNQAVKHMTLESQTQEKASYLSVLENDEAEINAALDELEQAQKEIQRFVASIQAKYKMAYMGSGAMGWPVPGYSRISSAYGYRNHPITKKRSFHTGIDIPAPRGTPARASEKGKVIFAAYNGAYGNTVILDHGGGMSSQYSHLHTIGVKVGDIVLKGDTVGGIGTTGWSTGNHLHFTIMKDGSTVSPLDYVKRP